MMFSHPKPAPLTTPAAPLPARDTPIRKAPAGLDQLAQLANQSATVQRLAALQRMADAGPTGAAGDHSVVPSGHDVAQLKPNNIRKTQKLKLDKTGAILNAEAERVDPPVSYPMNTLIALNLIDHDEVKGGHLFKREYGGLDNYANVVTWSERAEEAFTKFENRYLDQARIAAQAANKTVTYDVETEATFGSSTVTKDDLFTGPGQPTGSAANNARHQVLSLVKGALETVPSSVAVSMMGVGSDQSFSRDESKMLDKKVTPSAVHAQTQVNNIVNNVADDRLGRAADRLKSP